MRFSSTFFAREREAAKAISAMTMIATITITTISVVLMWGLPLGEGGSAPVLQSRKRAFGRAQTAFQKTVVSQGRPSG